MFRLKYTTNFIFSKVYNDTIFAVATNSSKPSPINIIRVSGPQSFKCLSLLSTKDLHDQNDKDYLLQKHRIKPRFVNNKVLYSHQNFPIDKCLLLYFPEGKSYNGEDIFEFHLHGSPAILKLMFSQLIRLGFRMAEPGQFTKRALVNNKMNILEIEGIQELIHSQNQFSRKIAMSHILGKTSKFLQDIKKQLVSCLAACEAFIDFQEDQLDVKIDLFDKTKVRALSIRSQIKQILSKKKQIQILSNGINIVIVGKPNAGKSTIINKLAKEEVAIVSDEPGTTRDIVKATFEYKGVSFNVSDTAGIRDTDQKVERQGIKRAIQRTKYSHINLLIVDGSSEQIIQNQQTISVSLKQPFEQQIFNSEKTIIILNKIDLLSLPKKKQIVVSSNKKERIADLSISALNQNIEEVLDHLITSCKQIYNIQQHKDQIILSRERHFDCLKNCLQHLQTYINTNQVDIASEQLRLTILEIGKILGRIDCEDVLDVLFKDFCIGK